MLKKALIVLLLILFLGLGLNIAPIWAIDIDVESDKVDQINKQIDDYKEAIEKLKEEEQVYEEKIEEARGDVKNLENKIYILKTKIAQKANEIKRKQKEIESKNLIIENIQKRVLQKEKELKKLKKEIKSLIQVLNIYDNKKPLGILFLESSLAGVLNQFRYLNSLHSEINQSLETVKKVKKGLEDHENSLRKELSDLMNLKKNLKSSKIDLENQRKAKEVLLDQTRGAEWRFQSLLANVVEERKAIENDIQSLEKKARKEIANKKEKIAQKLMEEEGRVIFSWPVPNTTITATFHDPDYPFKDWLGEHSAIDIRAKQGTPIRAPAAGYVARAKHGGMGYSYIMLIHNDEFSTIYGHVSDILVEEGEYVKRGDMIAKSGGMPGTPGAGKFSTGPHLHFGVRLNGVPVNPEDYLL